MKTLLRLIASCVVVASAQAIAQAPSEERIAAFARLPDWSGMWEPVYFEGQGIGQAMSEAGLTAARSVMGAQIPFNDEWQAKLDAALQAQAELVAADPDHPPAPAYDNCGSPPFIMKMFSPAVYQWRITPEETTIVDTIRGIRHIYTDGRSHPPADELWPTDTGNSIGRWEDYTLVVDTISVDPRLLLPGFVTVEMSDQLRFIERMYMVDEDHIRIDFIMQDPGALTEDFEVTLDFVRITDFDRMIDETNCTPETDRNPIIDGRFQSINTRE